MNLWTQASIQEREVQMKEPMKLMRKFLNGKVEQLEVGDIVVDIRGKTYYVTGWDEFRNTVQATSMCENHYFVDMPAKNFNCYFIGE